MPRRRNPSFGAVWAKVPDEAEKIRPGAKAWIASNHDLARKAAEVFYDQIQVQVSRRLAAGQTAHPEGRVMAFPKGGKAGKTYTFAGEKFTVGDNFNPGNVIYYHRLGRWVPFLIESGGSPAAPKGTPMGRELAHDGWTRRTRAVGKDYNARKDRPQGNQLGVIFYSNLSGGHGPIEEFTAFQAGEKRSHDFEQEQKQAAIKSHDREDRDVGPWFDALGDSLMVGTMPAYKGAKMQYPTISDNIEAAALRKWFKEEGVNAAIKVRRYSMASGLDFGPKNSERDKRGGWPDHEWEQVERMTAGIPRNTIGILDSNRTGSGAFRVRLAYKDKLAHLLAQGIAKYNAKVKAGKGKSWEKEIALSAKGKAALKAKTAAAPAIPSAPKTGTTDTVEPSTLGPSKSLAAKGPLQPKRIRSDAIKPGAIVVWRDERPKQRVKMEIRRFKKWDGRVTMDAPVLAYGVRDQLKKYWFLHSGHGTKEQDYAYQNLTPAPELTPTMLLGRYDKKAKEIRGGWGAALVRHYLDERGISYTKNTQFVYVVGYGSGLTVYDIDVPESVVFPSRGVPKAVGTVARPAKGDLFTDPSMQDIYIKLNRLGSVRGFDYVIESEKRKGEPRALDLNAGSLAQYAIGGWPKIPLTHSIFRKYGMRIMGPWIDYKRALQEATAKVLTETPKGKAYIKANWYHRDHTVKAHEQQRDNLLAVPEINRFLIKGKNRDPFEDIRAGILAEPVPAKLLPPALPPGVEPVVGYVGPARAWAKEIDASAKKSVAETAAPKATRSSGKVGKGAPKGKDWKVHLRFASVCCEGAYVMWEQGSGWINIGGKVDGKRKSYGWHDEQKRWNYKGAPPAQLLKEAAAASPDFAESFGIVKASEPGRDSDRKLPAMLPRELAKLGTWVKLGADIQWRWDGMTYAEVLDRRVAHDSNSTNRYETDDGELHAALRDAKLWAIGTEAMPRLVADGYMVPTDPRTGKGAGGHEATGRRKAKPKKPKTSKAEEPSIWDYTIDNALDLSWASGKHGHVSVSKDPGSILVSVWADEKPHGKRTHWIWNVPNGLWEFHGKGPPATLIKELRSRDKLQAFLDIPGDQGPATFGRWAVEVVKDSDHAGKARHRWGLRNTANEWSVPGKTSSYVILSPKRETVVKEARKNHQKDEAIAAEIKRGGPLPDQRKVQQEAARLERLGSVHLGLPAMPAFVVHSASGLSWDSERKRAAWEKEALSAARKAMAARRKYQKRALDFRRDVERLHRAKLWGPTDSALASVEWADDVAEAKNVRAWLERLVEKTENRQAETVRKVEALTHELHTAKTLWPKVQKALDKDNKTLVVERKPWLSGFAYGYHGIGWTRLQQAGYWAARSRSFERGNDAGRKAREKGVGVGGEPRTGNPTGRKRRRNAEELGTMEIGADATMVWKHAAHNTYVGGDLPVIAAREALQNSVDAIRAAIKARQVTKGRFDVEWDAGKRMLTFTDNGIGMDERVLRKFVTLGGTEKQGTEQHKAGINLKVRRYRKPHGDNTGTYIFRINGLYQFSEGSQQKKLDHDFVFDFTTRGTAGGFGYAKAVILGVSETFRWDIHTRDIAMEGAKAGRKMQPRRTARRQGTQLRVYDVSPKFENDYTFTYDPVLGKNLTVAERIKHMLGFNTLRDIDLYFNGKKVAPYFSGKRGTKIPVEVLDFATSAVAGSEGYPFRASRDGLQPNARRALRRFAQEHERNEKVVRDTEDEVHDPEAWESHSGDYGQMANDLGDALDDPEIMDALGKASEVMGRYFKGQGALARDVVEEAEDLEASDMPRGKRVEQWEDKALGPEPDRPGGKTTTFGDASIDAKVRAIRDGQLDSMIKGIVVGSSGGPPGIPLPQEVQDAIEARAQLIGATATVQKAADMAQAVDGLSEAVKSTKPHLSGKLQAGAHQLRQIAERGTVTTTDVQAISGMMETVAQAAVEQGGGGVAQVAAMQIEAQAILRDAAYASTEAKQLARRSWKNINPFGQMAGIVVKYKQFLNARGRPDKARARRFKQNSAKWVPYLLAWDACCRLIAKKGGIELSFKPGFILADKYIAMYVPRPNGRMLMINPHKMAAVAKAYRKDALSMAVWIHGTACHELAHMVMGTAHDASWGAHDEKWAIRREDLADKTAPLLPAMTLIAEKQLGLKAAPTRELERERARCKASVRAAKAKGRKRYTKAEAALKRAKGKPGRKVAYSELVKQLRKDGKPGVVKWLEAGRKGKR